MSNFSQAKIKEVKGILSKFIQPGKAQIITPYLVGYPGIGKSQTVAEFAKENDMQLIDLRLSQCLKQTDWYLEMIQTQTSSVEASVNIPWSITPISKHKGHPVSRRIAPADEAVIKACSN